MGITLRWLDGRRSFLLVFLQLFLLTAVVVIAFVTAPANPYPGTVFTVFGRKLRATTIA